MWPLDNIVCFHSFLGMNHDSSLFSISLADSGYNSTDVCSEATEMEYLRKVLFEYMMGRETKVCTSHENTDVWPVVAQIYARACFHWNIRHHPFRRLANDLK